MGDQRYWNQIPAAERLIIRTPNWGGEGCWEMEGTGPHGYPTIGVDGKRMLAHRFSYLLFVGDPTGMLVCHSCDNPKCVRPDHLFLGTHADNTADMMVKGRQKPPSRQDQCKRGHPITDSGPQGGRRRCLTCHRDGERKRREGSSHRK